MIQTAITIKSLQRIVFFLLVSIMLLSANGFAQDFENETGQTFVVSANIISVAANVSSERMSISYDGISRSGRMIYAFGENLYVADPALKTDRNLEKISGQDKPFKFGQKLKEITDCFFKYFSVDDLSSNDDTSDFVLKSKVDTDKIKANDFEFNLSLNISNDDDEMVRMNAVKLESFLHNTYVNAVYDYGKSELELGVSSAYVNQYLLNGMKLELQANPNTGSGAILLTKMF